MPIVIGQSRAASVRTGWRSGSAGPSLARLLFVLGVLLLGLGRLGPQQTLPPTPPAPAVVVAAEVPSVDAPPAEPRFIDTRDIAAPGVRAAAALIYNPRTHEVVWESSGLDQRPIASITKVMTALVLLDEAPDLSADVVVSRNDVRRASTTYLRRDERVAVNDLLHLALIASDNVAARVLARASDGGTRRFVERMNEKAQELGLDGTRFVEPSGLDERNVSTPYDVARLITVASENHTLAHIMRKESYRMQTSRRRLRVRNTNRLLRGQLLIQGGKTGYIDESGYCIAAMVKLPDSDPLAVVILGARSNSGRFREARRLVDWVSTKGRPLIDGSLRRAD